jgi:hypothetical protein
MCLAAWLTVATGFTVSATGAVWVQGGIVALWIAFMAQMAWRHRLMLRRVFR